MLALSASLNDIPEVPHRLVGTLEARHDRSTGEEGGYFEGADNVLVPDQTLVLVGLLWSFDR